MPTFARCQITQQWMFEVNSNQSNPHIVRSLHSRSLRSRGEPLKCYFFFLFFDIITSSLKTDDVLKFIFFNVLVICNLFIFQPFGAQEYSRFKEITSNIVTVWVTWLTWKLRFTFKFCCKKYFESLYRIPQFEFIWEKSLIAIVDVITPICRSKLKQILMVKVSCRFFDDTTSHILDERFKKVSEKRINS